MFDYCFTGLTTPETAFVAALATGEKQVRTAINFAFSFKLL